MKLLYLALLLMSVGFVSSLSIDYYYHPECGYCKSIEPLIYESMNSYPEEEWSLIDISIGSYAISGVPYINIKTEDNRGIELHGAGEIQLHLKCELDEQSNLNCPTYSATQCTGTRWFIK